MYLGALRVARPRGAGLGQDSDGLAHLS